MRGPGEEEEPKEDPTRCSSDDALKYKEQLDDVIASEELRALAGVIKERILASDYRQVMVR